MSSSPLGNERYSPSRPIPTRSCPQTLPEYDIALIVPRAFDSKLESYLPLMPEVQIALENIKAGEIIRIYADPKLRLKDQRRGRKRHDNN
jgi:hypothetical protein